MASKVKPFVEAALKPVNRVINSALKLDPNYAARLEPLAGKQLAVHVKDVDITLFIVFDDEILLCVQTEQETSEAKISADAATLFQLLLGQQDIMSSELFFEGNVKFAQAVQNFAKNIDIDWEDTLASYTGDIFAAQSFAFLRRAKSWLSHAATETRLNFQEYLTEESRSTPSRLEQENFFDDVDELSQDVDRIEARIRQLEQ